MMWPIVSRCLGVGADSRYFTPWFYCGVSAVFFYAAFCAALGVSSLWLLTIFNLAFLKLSAISDIF